MVIRFLLFLLVIFWFAFPCGLFSQALLPTENDVGQILTEQDVEVVADSIFEPYVRTSPWPAAAVAVVQGDRLVFAKGYGWKDGDRSAEISATTTGFHVASLSKLFIGTAILQLQEQGKLRLDGNINDYLGENQIQQGEDAPVRVYHLLTHTSGLDDHFLGSTEPFEEDRSSLQDYFKKYPLKPIAAPGTELVYSNHAPALAALIVEEVSGLAFHEYVQKNILLPLGMTHSSFLQPVPEELAKDFAPNRLPDTERIIPYPVASLSASAQDMAQFMMAHLDSQDGDSSLFRDPATPRKLHEPWFRAHEQMPGVTFGYFETFDHGRRILTHTGSRDHFSLLALVPEEELGVFVVMAGDHSDSVLRRHFLKALLRRTQPSGTRDRTPKSENVPVEEVPAREWNSREGGSRDIPHSCWRRREHRKAHGIGDGSLGEFQAGWPPPVPGPCNRCPNNS